MDLFEASAPTSLAGNSRSARTPNISRPTLPVAPMTATLYDISGESFRAMLLRQHLLHADDGEKLLRYFSVGQVNISLADLPCSACHMLLPS